MLIKSFGTEEIIKFCQKLYFENCEDDILVSVREVLLEVIHMYVMKVSLV